MRTKTLIQTAVATGALMWAAASFAATPVVPTQPPVIPAAGLPTNAATNGNGPLLVAVWDSVTGSSLVQYLGLDYGQISIPDMSAANTVLDFGPLSGFSTTFAGAIGAGQQSRLQYLVVAADTQADTAVGIGDPFNRGLRITGQPNLETAIEGSGDSGAFNVAGAGNAYVDFITQVINGTAASPLSCAKANPCSIIGDASSPIYFGKAQAGADLSGNAPSTTSYAGNVGTALNFFELISADANQFLIDGLTGATGTQYANAFGAATWLLDAAGRLVFTAPGGTQAPVPLPAAAWLLLSGLAGLGVVSRRRRESAAAAVAA
jgi:hypothetical protein